MNASDSHIITATDGELVFPEKPLAPITDAAFYATIRALRNRLDEARVHSTQMGYILNERGDELPLPTQSTTDDGEPPHSGSSHAGSTTLPRSVPTGKVPQTGFAAREKARRIGLPATDTPSSLHPFKKP